MSRKVRVGVIGTSWFADMFHLPNLHSHAQVELTAICGRNRQRAQEMADKYGIPQVFTDYTEMIADGGLEALVVAAPDDLHYPMTMAGLQAGLHVLCEKPMALNARHAQEMLYAAEAAGVKHLMSFTYRWSPPFVYLHKLVQEGYIGKGYYSQWRYVSGGGRQPDYHWHYDRHRAAGVLSNLGVHMIDMARWVLGEITQVNAQLPTHIHRVDNNQRPFTSANDDALLMVKFKENGHGMIHASAVAYLGDRGQQWQLVLYGEDGTLELDCSSTEGFTLRGARSDESHIHPLPVPDDLLQGIDPNSSPFRDYVQLFRTQPIGTRLFIDGILNDLDLTPDFRDGLAAQKVIDAALASDESGVWVAIE